ncbi:MaoC family dehydratase [Nocardioides sp. AN3]
MSGTSPITPVTRRDLDGLLNVELGPTPWREVTQTDVDAFAETTGDRQWIHVDVERAGASPLGGTIAHGLFTLALGPALTYQLISFDGFAHVLNYGYDTVRFPSALPVGSRVRMTATVVAVDEGARGIQLRVRQRFERQGHDRPVAVADSVTLLVEGR